MQIITFGCRLNAFESEVIQELTATMDNTVIINTCAVTSEAERQSRQAVRKAIRENPTATVIATGCAVQLNPASFQKITGLARVLGNAEKLDKNALFSDIPYMVSTPEKLPTQVQITDFSGRTRAFLQIQQGCDNHCTFCVVRLVRGKNVGLPVEKVVQQAQILADNGFKEVVLTGVDIASYPFGFSKLIEELVTRVPAVQRWRFGSLNPALIDEKFIRLVGRYPQIMPFFHFSIQSGSDGILKKMGRRHTRAQVINLINALKRVRPEATFGSDFITGFPTETEQDFKETYELVKELNITHLHVFPFSVRTGTPSAKLRQLPVPLRKERAAVLRALGKELYKTAAQELVGKQVEVLVEQKGIGLTNTYFKVNINPEIPPKEVVLVTIKERKENELVG